MYLSFTTVVRCVEYVFMLYLFQLEGLKQYSCEYCSEVCKSEGGHTKHIRSKHDVEASEDGVRQQFIHSNSIIFLMTGRDSIDFYARLILG